MKLNIKRKLYTGFAAAILLVLTVGVISYQTFDQQLYEAGQVRHSYQVINELSRLQYLLAEMQTGGRGFRSTNEKSFLSLISRRSRRLNPAWNALRI